MNRTFLLSAAVAGLCASAIVGRTALTHAQAASAAKLGTPLFEVDPQWPKVAGNWIFGSIGGIAVDPKTDHVWVLNRPRTLENDENYAGRTPPVGDCCVAAPSVMEFDAAGNYLGGWGGPGEGRGYEWPALEHGLSLDGRGNIWVLGNGEGDAQALKFTMAGKFLLQIGHRGKSQGSNDLENLNQPADAAYYAKTNEIFIADGYGNRRVIVFDADTGAYKRHWGAYGKRPDDTASNRRTLEGPAPQQYNTPHGILISNDDLVYLSEHSSNRIQVFRPDGTYLKEAFVDRKVATPTGTTLDIAFSTDPEQRLIFATGGDQHVRILRRDTLEPIGIFGRLGRYPGQFDHLHVVAVDSKGNLYTGENNGKRVQKFVFKGYGR